MFRLFLTGGSLLVLVAACNGKVAGGAGADNCSSGTFCENLYGAAPCGSWLCNNGDCEVNCPGCADADRDGYGTGTCAGPDCDDNDDKVFANFSRSCYSGIPATTAGHGVCTTGTQTCTAGVIGPCVGEVIPSGEACNNEDDDCNDGIDDGLGNITCGSGVCANSVPACGPNGVVGVCTPNSGNAATNDATCDGVDDDCDGALDEDCIANCVWVTVAGSVAPDGSIINPFSSIQAAIAAADPIQNKFVCVASTTCAATATYSEAITMRSGVHVYGRWDQSSFASTPAQCAAATYRTRITIPAPGAGTVSTGVLFDSTVTTTTILDGFEIVRPDFQESSGITVDGASGVSLNDIRIQANTGGATQNSFGVNVVNGGSATMTRSDIMGGNGSALSIGVRAVAGTVMLNDNCPTFDASGRCNTAPGTGPGIRGRTTAGTGEAYAVYLESAPNSVVDRSALSNVNSTAGGAAVRVTGDATGLLIRANNLVAWGQAVANAHGVWLTDCGGAAPWILDNFRISGQSSNPLALVDGIRAIGDCHPVIDSNLSIVGGAEGGASSPNGIYCGSDTSGASRCVVLGNANVQGSGANFPPLAVGVRCDDGACSRIAGNTRITGNSGQETYGLWLQNSGPLIDNNGIIGGCGTAGNPPTTGSAATGVYANGSFARLQNNQIAAGHCGSVGTNNPLYIGLHVAAEAGATELDVHSNLIDGGGDGRACTSVGIQLDVGANPATAMEGVFRNNIVLAGSLCTTARYNVVEADTAADPRVFENNDLDPTARGGGAAPTALYVDENDATNGLQVTDVEVNAMTGGRFVMNISADPNFVNYSADPHLTSPSPCDGAGTPAGAPALDMDGDARNASTPDIGPDEI